MKTPLYLNPKQPVRKRVQDLISRLTLEEKIFQMVHNAPAIPRLDIPEYDWWNECLHGVGRAGLATVFPQSIGLASTWDVPLMHRIATAISDEARAKHHEALRRDDRSRYTGLTFWSPNINIFRDPRWGRGQETFGEDPYLTARLGVAFVRGLQGDHRRYLKLVATPKHFAVHSGPEHRRHSFDARVSLHDLYETYLPAFKACVQEGGAVSVMGAYNRTNGEACCASPTLLEKILRLEWGFGGMNGQEGYVVSDCGAIRDIYANHRIVETAAEAAALAVKAGCDLNCGETYPALLQAVRQGLIDEATIDLSLERLFTARFRLGMFDPPESVPYAHIPYAVNNCAEHRQLALQAGRESIILLKNDGLLPLSLEAGNIKTIAVIGPNAADERVLLGNYNGTPWRTATILDGVRERAYPHAEVLYARGCEVLGAARAGFDEALELARRSDLIILALGLSQLMEGEEGQEEGVQPGQASLGDRNSLDLPGVQEELLKELYATGKPIVLVLLNGSALAVNWADENLPAILEAWYPGQAGGIAVAEVLFGDYNPAGRLPVTFYRTAEDLPPFDDYNMAGRTYRYFDGEPLYPFGFGLSYTRFSYSNLHFRHTWSASGRRLNLQLQVQNIGEREGDEVVQVYVQHANPRWAGPLWQLAGFTRLRLSVGEVQRLSFTLSQEQLSQVDDQGQLVFIPGEIRLAVGGQSPGWESAGQLLYQSLWLS
ncbi:MAG: glycoside hydrolase family 3 C-terminal domain-containing protein [Anaerolineales bacterium]|nr:glycoside hydrolase family 3 C-terminal domain-containing protein [Anaerolineales bacterium]